MAKNLSRRGLAALAFAAISSAALAQSQSDLAQPGPLGDRVLGNAEAPVTIIEYASLTCSHCAAFHAETLPALKKDFIETGKVRLVFREFPFDPLSVAASMLARCTSEARYFPLVDLFFKQQSVWARSEKPLDEMLAIAKQAGFTKDSFEACLKDQKVYDGINAVKTRAAEKFGVESTPTFFINGKKHSGNMSIAAMEKLITPLLPK